MSPLILYKSFLYMGNSFSVADFSNKRLVHKYFTHWPSELRISLLKRGRRPLSGQSPLKGAEGILHSEPSPVQQMEERRKVCVCVWGGVLKITRLPSLIYTFIYISTFLSVYEMAVAAGVWISFEDGEPSRDRGRAWLTTEGTPSGLCKRPFA